MSDFIFNSDAGPIYKQVYSWLKNKMISGEWTSGKQIPPEVILSTDLKVSRHTVRKALELLVNDGFLYRQSGKGTFVNNRKSNYKLSYLYSFTEQMKDLGRAPSSKIIDIETNRIPSQSIRSRLSLSEHERVTRICRLRLADNKPMSLEEVFLNDNLAPDIQKKDLQNNSLYMILENDYHLVIKHGDVNLGATAATESQADQLGVERNSPLVYMDCLTYLENQRPAFLTYARYPYDRYVFTLDLPRNNG